MLRARTDLDGYVAQLDREAAETGLHNPIVRKAVGQVYLEKEQFAKAIAQLQLACELQPDDAETHQALVACYDRQEDKPGAIRQVLASLALSRRNIKLCEDLGRRYDAQQEPAEAERAYTSIVELLPSESESHTLLAEIRQRQDRWDEAILHWQQVARIRALEPTGLLKLAEAQIHQKQWDGGGRNAPPARTARLALALRRRIRPGAAVGAADPAAREIGRASSPCGRTPCTALTAAPPQAMIKGSRHPTTTTARPPCRAAARRGLVRLSANPRSLLIAVPVPA